MSRKFKPKPNEFLRAAFAAQLRECGEAKDLIRGQLIHSRMLEQPDLLPDIFLENHLVHMYGKCSSMDEARRAFDSIRHPNIFSWSILITAYSQNGKNEQARALFESMSGRNVVTWTTLLSAYARWGDMRKAKHVLERMPEAGVVAWNGMIAGYGQSREFDYAKSTFDSMPERNVSSWNVLISVAAQRGSVREAVDVYELMPERNSMAWNPIIHAHNLLGDVSSAREFFESLPDRRSLVSSATMICGYARSGRIEEAKALFTAIPNPDSYAWTSMFQAFANVGKLAEARGLFDSMPSAHRDAPSWNAMLSAYAHNGHGEEALDLFTLMVQEGVTPNEKSFTTILHACSHVMGSCDLARFHFVSLQGDHFLVPDSELYCGMVDVLARNGKLGDGEELANTMPCAPNAVAWGSLLAACRLYHDSKRAPGLADKFMEHLETSPSDPSLAAEPYVQLTNIYRAEPSSSLFFHFLK